MSACQVVAGPGGRALLHHPAPADSTSMSGGASPVHLRHSGLLEACIPRTARRHAASFSGLNQPQARTSTLQDKKFPSAISPPVTSSPFSALGQAALKKGMLWKGQLSQALNAGLDTLPFLLAS